MIFFWAKYNHFHKHLFQIFAFYYLFQLLLTTLCLPFFISSLSYENSLDLYLLIFHALRFSLYYIVYIIMSAIKLKVFLEKNTWSSALPALISPCSASALAATPWCHGVCILLIWTSCYWTCGGGGRKPSLQQKAGPEGSTVCFGESLGIGLWNNNFAIVLLIFNDNVADWYDILKLRIRLLSNQTNKIIESLMTSGFFGFI